MKKTMAQNKVNKFRKEKNLEAMAFYTSRYGMKEKVKQYVNQFVKPKKGDIKEDDTSNQRRKG